ncbi:MAG: hypothetical protein Q7J69_06710 [Candidatus Omnitrophota bacterium]|nr:hypothetical protein [Candidatus Omnitrophota bacterium]
MSLLQKYIVETIITLILVEGTSSLCTFLAKRYEGWAWLPLSGEPRTQTSSNGRVFPLKYPIKVFAAFLLVCMVHQINSLPDPQGIGDQLNLNERAILAFTSQKVLDKLSVKADTAKKRISELEAMPVMRRAMLAGDAIFSLQRKGLIREVAMSPESNEYEVTPLGEKVITYLAKKRQI